VVDLSPDENILRRKLAGKWRTDLKFAQRAGLNVEHGGSSLYNRFLRLFGAMHDRKEFRVHVDPRFFFELPAASLGLEVLIATKDGDDAAGHVVSFLGDTAVYLFGATNEIGRACKAGYLLNWQALLQARKRGLAWYDLGGIDQINNPGGHRFKTRMGGCEISAPGPYEIRAPGITGGFVDAVLAVRSKMRRS
jgi:lipid II:glycine glycyltransferase (peptidoglycan interpeptide bridge formation enzyme)